MIQFIGLKSYMFIYNKLIPYQHNIMCYLSLFKFIHEECSNEKQTKAEVKKKKKTKQCFRTSTKILTICIRVNTRQTTTKEHRAFSTNNHRTFLVKARNGSKLWWGTRIEIKIIKAKLKSISGQIRQKAHRKTMADQIHSWPVTDW